MTIRKLIGYICLSIPFIFAMLIGYSLLGIVWTMLVFYFSGLIIALIAIGVNLTQ